MRKEKEECLMSEHLRPSPHHKFVLGADSEVAHIMKPYLTRKRWEKLFCEPELLFESNNVTASGTDRTNHKRGDEASCLPNKKNIFAKNNNKTYVLESHNDQVIYLKGLGSYAPLVQNEKPVLKKNCVPSPVNVLEKV